MNCFLAARFVARSVVRSAAHFLVRTVRSVHFVRSVHSARSAAHFLVRFVRSVHSAHSARSAAHFLVRFVHSARSAVHSVVHSGWPYPIE